MQNSDWQSIDIQFSQADFSSSFCGNTIPGIVEQSDGIWAVLVNCPGGILTAEQFAALANIVSDDGLGVKLTSRQTPILLLPKHKVTEALKIMTENNLRPAFVHGSLRNVKACIGSRGCKNARRSDVLKIAKTIDDTFYGAMLPWDFKIALSGCSRNCSSATCQSLGLVETCQGFDLYLGGTEGVHNATHGTLMASNLREEKILSVIEVILKCYIWATNKLAEKGRIESKPHFPEVFKKIGREFFAEAIDEALDRHEKAEIAITSHEELSDKLPGFNKENTFSAFVTLNKLCTHCPECKKFKCHLFIAKDILSEAARTGKKFLEKIPADMISLLRAMPIAPNSFEQFKLMDAYHNIIDICDQCLITDHEQLCSVNVSLTSIGCLINGSSFKTKKDKEKENLLL